ncbi:MAG: EutN/CcmL family microcompartment protein [Clostridia bacterium]|nr:EutN/CcmL family microcompartment protein [Clostridia bacterium]
MEIATVIGHVWATKKEATLEGSKLMIVRPYAGDPYVAADVVGAGIGEEVLVVSGSTARRALGSDNCAIDNAIVGIIDTVEVDRELEAKKRAAEKAKPKK